MFPTAYRPDSVICLNPALPTEPTGQATGTPTTPSTSQTALKPIFWFHKKSITKSGLYLEPCGFQHFTQLIGRHLIAETVALYV